MSGVDRTPGLSVAHADAIDLPLPGLAAGGTGKGPGPSDVRQDHPARARLEEALQRALSQLGPVRGLTGVAVAGPVHEDGPDGATDGYADALSEALGEPVRPADTAGWLTGWQVLAAGQAGLIVIPARARADLAVEFAGWLQSVAADLGDGRPLPPCPGHRHPMLPTVLDADAWWSCPTSEPVRAW